jgi:hypothetical protein
MDTKLRELQIENVNEDEKPVLLVHDFELDQLDVTNLRMSVRAGEDNYGNF